MATTGQSESLNTFIVQHEEITSTLPREEAGVLAERVLSFHAHAGVVGNRLGMTKILHGVASSPRDVLGFVFLESEDGNDPPIAGVVGTENLTVAEALLQCRKLDQSDH